MPDRKLESSMMSIHLQVGDKQSPGVKDKLTQICGTYLLASLDFMYFPSGAVLIYTGLIFIAIFLSYWFSSKSVKQGNIIEAMKNEIV